MSPSLGFQLFLFGKDDIHSRLWASSSRHFHIVTEQDIQAL